MLTEKQQQVVNHTTGAALVIAGPGAGKTHVLAHRAVALISDGAMGDEILMLTFTRRAANEMRQRVTRIMGGAISVTACTFHALAARLLWQSGERAAVLTDGDTHDLINSIRKAMQLRAKDLPARDVLAAYSLSRNTGEAVSGQDARYYQIVAEYTRLKTDMRVMDYDDLLIRLRDRLRDDPEFREKQYAAFRFIMVDEYQDTNALQAEILCLLSEQGNIMAVGDDAQSIYAFRGATVENILRFTTAFPNAVTYHLTENFRSVTPIIVAANRLIQAMPRKLEKTLTSTRGDGRAVSVTAYANAWQEAEGIIDTMGKEFIDPSDCAVLYRNSFHALTLELALTKAKIPYQKFGGRRITEAAHVRDLCACVWILVTPQHRLAWQRVLALLPGIGAKTASSLAGYLAGAKDLRTAMQTARVPAKTLDAWQIFCAWYRESAYTTAQEAVQWAWAWYDPYFCENYPDEIAWREEGIKGITEVAAQYETPQQFLNEFVLEQDDAAAASVKLTLSTIHSAKGREWGTVFVMHAADKTFPAYDSDLEEERRLFYVAVTRAKNDVYLSYPKRRQMQEKDVWCDPSPFLKEIAK